MVRPEDLQEADSGSGKRSRDARKIENGKSEEFGKGERKEQKRIQRLPESGPERNGVHLR